MDGKKSHSHSSLIYAVYVLFVIYLVYAIYGIIIQNDNVQIQYIPIKQHALRHSINISSSVAIHHNITIRGDNYATFGCSVSNMNYDYAFHLPLTVLAWEKQGFKSLVILMGTRDYWTGCEVRRYILEHLEQRECRIVFLTASKENEISLSQTARLFSYRYFTLPENAYILTSDADLWPLQRNHYIPSPGKVVLSTNAYCCKSFIHNGTSYDMQPMSTIGMSVQHWRRMMEGLINTRMPDDPSANQILNYFAREFGAQVFSPVEKGMNFGWFMDQQMVSVRLKQLEIQDGVRQMQFTRHHHGIRIDKTNWKIPPTLSGKVGAHMLLRAHLKRVWKKIVPLLEKMYGAKSAEFNWANAYQAGFPNITC